MRAIRRFNVRAVLPEPLVPLEALAHNLRWCWSPNTRDLFAAMDAKLWKSLGQDPVRLLGEITAERLAELAADEGYVGWVRERADDLQNYLTAERWFQTLGADAPAGIAYFSPEYGITSALRSTPAALGFWLAIT